MCAGAQRAARAPRRPAVPAGSLGRRGPPGPAQEAGAAAGADGGRQHGTRPGALRSTSPGTTRIVQQCLQLLLKEVLLIKAELLKLLTFEVVYTFVAAVLNAVFHYPITLFASGFVLSVTFCLPFSVCSWKLSQVSVAMMLFCVSDPPQYVSALGWTGFS